MRQTYWKHVQYLLHSQLRTEASWRLFHLYVLVEWLATGTGCQWGTPVHPEGPYSVPAAGTLSPLHQPQLAPLTGTGWSDRYCQTHHHLRMVYIHVHNTCRILMYMYMYMQCFTAEIETETHTTTQLHVYMYTIGIHVYTYLFVCSLHTTHGRRC